MAAARLGLCPRLAAAGARPGPGQGAGRHRGHLRGPGSGQRAPGPAAGGTSRCWSSASPTTSRVPRGVPELLTAAPVHGRIALRRAAGPGSRPSRGRGPAPGRRLAPGRGARRRCGGRSRACRTAGCIHRPLARLRRMCASSRSALPRPRCGRSARTAPATPPDSPTAPGPGPGFEDSAVPPERLGSYLRELRALLERARDAGHLLRPLRRGLHPPAGRLRPQRDRRRRALRALHVGSGRPGRRSHGGSLSGEHGDGRSRGPLLETQFSPDHRGIRAVPAHLGPDRRRSTRASSSIRSPITDGLRATTPTLLELRAPPRPSPRTAVTSARRSTAASAWAAASPRRAPR